MESMNSRVTCVLVGFLAALTIVLSGCGANSNSSTNNPSGTQAGQLSMMISDDPTNDWATVGVKVLSISLKPQGGGTPVVVFTATSPAPMINLVELDQLAEIIGNVSVPAGTYTGATLTLSGNPGDVVLTASSEPDPGFAGTPGASVPSGQIQIQGTTGSAGSLTVPLNVNFVSPLVVTANQNNALDLEFDLSHPAFIVAHVPPSSGQVMWAVNFNGPFRHHPIRDITALVLRHLYGSVNSVSADNTSMSITRVFPVHPATSPEQSISSSQSLTILADAANGTLFYDVDAKTNSTIMNFSSVASSLKGKFVRVAARYQVDGSLVAVRIWASSSFNSVWLSPEGHVLHVTTSSLVVENEDGTPVTINIGSGTQFFFRTPAKAQSDDKAIGSGPTFLTNLVRGFKVHVSVVDPLAVPLVADTVDIEIARFDGAISSPGLSSFMYTRHFATLPSPDDYTKTMPYISSSTPNGKDPLTGAAITGFKWWFFAFPTIVDSGTNAISDFIKATNGSVNFGGTVGTLTAVGGSYSTWGDQSNPNGWSAPWTVLAPVPVPLAKVSAAWVTNTDSSGATFNLQVGTGLQVKVNASATSGSATLVDQVDRQSNGIVTVSPQDLTTSSGLSNVAGHLVPPTLVKVYGVPQSDGSIKAYVIFYFTGSIMPGS
jgi:hypothetical protein